MYVHVITNKAIHISFLHSNIVTISDALAVEASGTLRLKLCSFKGLMHFLKNY